MAESRLRFTKISADRIMKEHKKFFGDKYKKVKTAPNTYKLVKLKKKSFFDSSPIK